MTPWWLQALGYLAGLFAAFTVGWVANAHRAAWERAHDVADIANLVGQLVEAERQVAERGLLIAALIRRQATDDTGVEAEAFGNRVPVPPDVWRNLMEARENREAN